MHLKKHEAAERFPVVKPDFRSPRQAHRITCSGCAFTSDMTISRVAGLPPEVTARKFQQRGWLIGKSAHHDLCPACVAGNAKPSKAKESNVTNMKAAPPAPIVNIRPEAPREPTVEQRRIIFSSINDHYLDAKRGYADDWTDQKIATDLGVPRAWVTTMRDENFGPARDNEAIQAALVEYERLRTDVSALQGNLIATATAMERIEKRLRELEPRVASIKKAVGV